MRRQVLEREDSVSGLVEASVPRNRCGDGIPSVPWELWRDHVLFARSGDADALARLVDEYEAYARSLAGRMARGNESREDLDQLALEALIVALRRFEPERGIPFPAFATPTILGALRRHFRDHGWLVRVSRRVHELASAQRDAVERLTRVLGRAPTDEEVAEAIGVSIDELESARQAIHARDTRSIDSVMGDGLSLEHRLGRTDIELEHREDHLALRAAMDSLDDEERKLIGFYYFEERSQADIAEILGVSQMQVSRLLNSIIRRLRARVLPIAC